MKKNNRAVWAAVLTLAFLLAQAGPIGAQGTGAKPDASPYSELGLAPLFQYFSVDGDAGRFRQDWRLPTGFSAGVETFELKTRDEKVQLSGYAVSENDYGHEILVTLPQDRSLKIKGKYFRQYYDGSNEPWDAAIYSLPAEFVDWEDKDLYADRLAQSIEFRVNVDPDTRWAVGYDLWGRFGRERLLRGEQTAATGIVNRRSVPTRAYLDGLSHTFYAEYGRTLGEKWNLKVRPSYELYADTQEVQFYRYNNGLLNQDRTFFDAPKFQDLNLRATLDGFYNADLYLYTGYLFNYLQNNGVRSEVRPISNSSTWTDPSVDNVRIANAGNLGAVILNFLGIKDLRLSAASRVEGADTDSNAYGTTGPATRGNFGHKELRSDAGEFKVSESVGLLYKGIPKTSMELSAELEQRHLDYEEYFDAGSMEAFVDFGASTRFFFYEADMDYNDLKTTARVSRRFDDHLKANMQYRLRYRDYDLDIQRDTETVFYPGVLGDMRRKVQEVTGGLDVWLVESWSSGFKYQYIGDTLHTQAGGDDVQDSNRHRLTASLTGQPVQRLTTVFSATYESYALDTPTDAPVGTTWFLGTAPYDYRGDYFIYNISGTWSLADATKLHGRFQQTSSLGTTADVQKNDLYELRVGVSHKFDSNTKINLEYLYFDFNDENDIVRGMDNYDGHGVIGSFLKKF